MKRGFSTVKTALTVAGSDPSGGAGIQADLKAFAATGVYGLSVISAITAQNSHGVLHCWPLTNVQVSEQLRLINADYPIHAMKTGMLANIEVVNALVENLPNCLLVIDPVMRASLGAQLISDDGLRAAQTHLWPKSALLTPNIPEAEAILGISIADQKGMLSAARALFDFNVPAVLLKGGHLPSRAGIAAECNDLLLIKDAPDAIWLAATRQNKKTHGTGCVFSALITANLALGLPLALACQRAHASLQCALAHAHPMGELQRGSPDGFSERYTKADYDYL